MQTIRVSAVQRWSICQKVALLVLTLAASLYILHSITGDTTLFTAGNRYGIIFDAGSTGSRIHVFRLRSINQGKSFALVDELFLQIKPGLSAYRDAPEKGAESLRSLMDAAKRYIPESQWKNTPIALKATAGLRALPEATAASLLIGIDELFKSYPFMLNKGSVQIMEGNDEGIFSWVTVNLLKGSIGHESSQLIGVLDLGGGSTQITFVPQAKIHNATIPATYFTKFNLFSDHFNLYTHSYLGLGLISSRLSILKASIEEGKDAANTGKKGVLTSSCLPNKYAGTLSSNGDDYRVSGVTNMSTHRYERCYAEVTSIVRSVVIHNPLSLLSTESHLCLISYFYDMAVEALLIAPACHGRCIRYVPFQPENLSPLCQDKERGGIIEIHEFTNAAKKVCSESVIGSNPFLCMDLTYISTLLIEGYNFKPDMNVELRKKIGGTEISWALGAMFNMLSNA